MKNLLKLFIAMCIFCTLPAFCEEVNLEQIVNDNRATIAIQKQPTMEQGQKQEAKQNKWCIIIQVNGKIKNIDADNK